MVYTLVVDEMFIRNVKFTPYWWEEAPRPEIYGDGMPSAVDVAIVGGGYSGLSAALTIVRGGRSVAVLEADRPGEGASSRNGGAIGATLRFSFSKLAAMHGLETALRYYSEMREARSWLYDFIKREGIECDLHQVGRFTGCHRPKDYDLLGRDLDFQKKHLGTDGEIVSQAEQHFFVGSDIYYGGRFLSEDGNLHPGKLHQGLLAKVMAEGVPVLGRSKVTAIRRDNDGFSLQMGFRSIKARQLVIATNGYTGKEFQWLRRRVLPIQSQIIATEPLHDNIMNRLIPENRQLGDTSRLHYYYRASPGHDRILFGGRVGAGEIYDRRKSGRLLYRRLIKVFPQLNEVKITHSWGGFIAYTFDHMLHMAQNDSIFYVAGFCGSGVVNANYLGHKTGLKVLGKPEGETVFDSDYPLRLFYSGKPWFLAPVIALKYWQDKLGL